MSDPSPESPGRIGSAAARAARRRSRIRKDRLFVAVCAVAAAVGLLSLLVLLGTIAVRGWEHLDLDLVTRFASRHPEHSGFKASLWGTVAVALVCAAAALPVGVGTAVLLVEFEPRSRLLQKLHGFLQLNVPNLAGVPSIVYGIIGLTAFVQFWNLIGTPSDPAFLWFEGTPFELQLPFGRSVLAGGLTLMLVVLPIVIVASQEALRAVPDGLRETALALGATRWQMVAKVTLPSALPGIMTGSILAMSRAMGEAAPMLVVAGVVYLSWTPESLVDDFTVLPLQIFSLARRSNPEFHDVAASGILLLLALLLSFNSVAVFIRHRFERRPR